MITSMDIAAVTGKTRRQVDRILFYRFFRLPVFRRRLDGKSRIFVNVGEVIARFTHCEQPLSDEQVEKLHKISQANMDKIKNG